MAPAENPPPTEVPVLRIGGDGHSPPPHVPRARSASGDDGGGDDEAAGARGNVAPHLAGIQGTVVRNVLVMMPFRSDDQFARRTQILEFMRLKHIVENIQVQRWLRRSGADDAEQITQYIDYRVRVLHQRVGYFPERALKEIAEADVLIGVVSHDSTNVIFELATRHLLRDGLVLLLDGNPQLLPIYFEGMIRIDYRQFRSLVVDRVIRRLAASEDPIDFRSDVPAELVDVIDRHERELAAELGNALREIEEADSLRPVYIRHLARYVSPSSIVEAWETYHPFCVVEVWWNQMGGDGHYKLEDCAGGPWIAAANDAFRALYGLQTIPDPTVCPHPLSALALIERLHAMGVLENRDAFLDDQKRISEAIFFRQQNLPAVQALVVNAKHDDLRFRNKKLLPTIVGRTTIGALDRRHKSCLTVLYVPVEEHTV